MFTTVNSVENIRSARRSRTMSPARLRILETIEAQPGAITSVALALHSGLHENTIRGHLDALLAQGYISRTPAPATGRGRPAWLWQAAFPDGPSEEQHRAALDYAKLAVVLADALTTLAPDPISASRQAGHAWGQQVVCSRPRRPDISPHDSVATRSFAVEVLDELGYQPAPDLADVEVDLHNCPLLEAASHNPEVICNVHLGLIHGALAAVGVDANGSTLTPFSQPGICHLTLAVQAIEDQP